jgi:hypothetical protein
LAKPANQSQNLYFAARMSLHTPYKLLKLYIFLLIFSPIVANSQNFYFYGNGYYEPKWVVEISPNIGILNAVTDIGGSKKGENGLGAYNLRNPRLAGGITLSATHRDLFAVRIDLNAGSIEDQDSLLKGATHYSAIGRFERNLSFRTPMLEASISAELHPLFFLYYESDPPRLSPFIMGGVGLVNFKPKARIDDQWVELKPLSLEGQGFPEYPDRTPYKNTTPTLLAGLGLRYEVSRIISLRLEAIHRWTRSDYLDDVSQGDWVDPTLFYQYMPVGQANLASRLYNRSVKINPPRNTRPRGDETDNDFYWGVQFRIGFALNRNRR